MNNFLRKTMSGIVILSALSFGYVYSMQNTGFDLSDLAAAPEEVAPSVEANPED